jgi:hypothetical protein
LPGRCRGIDDRRQQEIGIRSSEAETTVDRPDVVEQPGIDKPEDGSMRVLEYAVCALAAVAALLLGFIR